MTTYDDDYATQAAGTCSFLDEEDAPRRQEKCSDFETFRIMNKFKRFYEGKLEEIDNLGGGDCLELKLKVQQKWIEDLTEQTEMMARVVTELEDEASCRIKKLEEKLRQTAKCANEKVYYLENDVKNLVEFIKRVREQGQWSIDGLQFFDVTYTDLFGIGNKSGALTNDHCICVQPHNMAVSTNDEDHLIVTELNDDFDNIQKQLQEKKEECEKLKQTMLDMREALTEEVACKHDTMMSLKKDLQQLEERCLQADKQTAFKDDIIKELRKEIKQLKLEIDCKNKELQAEVCCLKRENENLLNCRLNKQNQDSCSTKRNRDQEICCKMPTRENELETCLQQAQSKITNLECTCRDLECTLKNSKDRAENLQKADHKCVSKNELKKLRQAKRCYEHVIGCFKQEMAIMSEQLIHLQDILNLSNQSCKTENDNLYSAVCDLQGLCERLNTQLQDSEKQSLMESQMNHMKDAKIEELTQIICQKNCELNRHDEAINEIKGRLEQAVLENHALQGTNVALNSKIMQLKCAIKNSEVEKAQKPCHDAKEQVEQLQKSIVDLNKKKKLDRLQHECEKQRELLHLAQKDLDKNKDKLKVLKKQNEELRKKLCATDVANQQMNEEICTLREQLTQMAQKECCREQELAQHKQMAIELRQTLIEMNETLAESHVNKLCMTEEIMKKKAEEEREKEDLYLSCRCEIALYKKLAENFKKSLHQSEKKLNELVKCNRKLSEALKLKDEQICQLHRKIGKREHEMTSFAQEANEKLKQIQDEKMQLCDTVDYMKTELKKKGNSDANKAVLVRTQEELTCVRNEMRNMIQNQLALNSENDKLLAQISRLQSLITPLEEKNRILCEKLMELSGTKEQLQSEMQELDKTNKEIKEASENIEAELEETRTNRDEICDEGRCVLNTVRVWLNEQRKIDAQYRQRQASPGGRRMSYQCSPREDSSPPFATSTPYPPGPSREPQRPVVVTDQCRDPRRDARREMSQAEVAANHAKLAQDEILMRDAEAEYCRQGFMPHRFKRRVCTQKGGHSRRTPERYNVEKVGQPPCPPYRSPYNLGSQGTDSLADRDSPTSFATCSVEEWYSPNYRDEDETDYQEEDFIRRIEAMTNELRNNNKKFKCVGECKHPPTTPKNGRNNDPNA